MKTWITDEMLSRFLDGELPEDEARRVREALRDDPALRRTLESFQMQADLHKSLPVEGAPTPEAMWQDVQRGIRLAKPERSGPVLVFPWRLAWVSAIVAAALVAAGNYLWFNEPSDVAVAPPAGDTTVEFVEAGGQGSSTMVYEDAETGWTVIWVAAAEPPPAGSGS